jgi:hypothetical protein
MALANPSMSNPLESKATVLIDEIDLHLHPEWQRRVVSDLLTVFPKTTLSFPKKKQALDDHGRTKGRQLRTCF